MSYLTFNDLNQQLTTLFQNKQFAEALDLITREGPNFPDDRLMADYWHMCAAARVGDRLQVFQVAKQIHADRLWYGDLMWRQTPSFVPLQGDPDFERLVAASRALQQADERTDAPVMLTHLPSQAPQASQASQAFPLLIALHGNMTTAAATLPFWLPAVSQGWALAVPQSTQAIFSGAYAWNELEDSFAYIQSRFAQLQKEIPFDPHRVVLGGHSMGGLVALQMALTGALPLRGVIANGPALPFQDAPAELDALLPQARERGLRVCFLIGEKDDDINQADVLALAAKFQAAGLPCHIEPVPGATHDYTPAYDAAMLHALAFMDS